MTETLENIHLYFNFFPVANTTEEESIELTALHFIEDLVSESFEGDYSYFLNSFAESKHIGCGKAEYDGRPILDDDFLPHENSEVQSVFAVHCIYDIRAYDQWLDDFPEGEPCSQCDLDEKCDEIYSNLCTEK